MSDAEKSAAVEMTAGEGSGPGTRVPRLHPLRPGERIPGDWFNGLVPANIAAGENSVIDSSYCFNHFFSRRPIGLRVGRNVTLWRTSLAAEEEGLIEIGDFSFIANASLVCSERITIGSHVMIAGGVTIVDSDFHPVSPIGRIADTIALSPLGDREHRPPISVHPVVVGDDVWIGFNATILKGVHIGDGAIIEPATVVLRDVPPGARMSGNPAQPFPEGSA